MTTTTTPTQIVAHESGWIIGVERTDDYPVPHVTLSDPVTGAPVVADPELDQGASLVLDAWAGGLDPADVIERVADATRSYPVWSLIDLTIAVWTADISPLWDGLRRSDEDAASPWERAIWAWHQAVDQLPASESVQATAHDILDDWSVEDAAIQGWED